jgi:hypothetical protein
MMKFTNQLASPKFLACSVLYFAILFAGLFEILPMEIISFFQVCHPY